MAGDPNYASVSLLLHGNGANGSTTFTDNSPAPHTMAANGNAQISTAQSVFGGAAMLFDGTGDYLSTPDATDLRLGGSDFTIEFRVRFAGWSANNSSTYASCIVSKDLSTGREFSVYFAGTASSFTTLRFEGFSSNLVGTVVTASVSLALNTWYSVAVVRSGNLVYLFLNGALLNAGGTAFSKTIQGTSTTLKVGAQNYDATYLYATNGYIDELRITKGVARYTASYTPATIAFSSGLGEVAGIIRDDTGAPCARTVRIHNRSTGALISSTTSDASTGAYILAAPTLDEVQRIVLDDTAGTLYNDLIDRVIPG